MSIRLLAVPREMHHCQANETEGWLTAAKTIFQNPARGPERRLKDTVLPQGDYPITDITITPPPGGLTPTHHPKLGETKSNTASYFRTKGMGHPSLLNDRI